MIAAGPRLRPQRASVATMPGGVDSRPGRSAAAIVATQVQDAARRPRTGPGAPPAPGPPWRAKVERAEIDTSASTSPTSARRRNDKRPGARGSGAPDGGLRGQMASSPRKYSKVQPTTAIAANGTAMMTSHHPTATPRKMAAEAAPSHKGHQECGLKKP